MDGGSECCLRFVLWSVTAIDGAVAPPVPVGARSVTARFKFAGATVAIPDDIARIVAARLVVGDVVSEIAVAAKIGTDRIWAARLELSEADRQRRTLAVRARIARGKALQREDIMGMIEAAVPRRIDAMLRDDVVGEIFLAVIEGRIEVEQIKAAVRSFVAKGIAQWQSAYGPRSLDQKLFADGSRTLGDMLEDETTTAQIDQLELGDRT